MINLLVDSLMADRGLEDALTAAIAAEVRDGRSVSLSEVGGESESAAVPLLHLVRQLLGNATGRQLSALKKVCYWPRGCSHRYSRRCNMQIESLRVTNIYVFLLEKT